MALEQHTFPSTLDRSAYQYVDNYLAIWEAMAKPLNRLRARKIRRVNCRALASRACS